MQIHSKFNSYAIFRGCVCIWDSKMGVCSEKHQTKLQHVQCLAVGPEKIYCGGVGKEIPVLLKTQGDYSTQWKVAAARNVHLHDVRALAAISDSELVSGGVDSYLIATNAPPVSIHVIPPFSGLVIKNKNFDFRSCLKSYLLDCSYFIFC